MGFFWKKIVKIFLTINTRILHRNINLFSASEVNPLGNKCCIVFLGMSIAPRVVPKY